MWLIRKVAPRLAGEGSVSHLQPLGASTKLELQMYISSKLRELRSLETGWDGGHAEPIAQSVTHQTYRVLDHLTESRSVYPFLTPTAEGGVLAEWRAGKERLEIEFSPGEPPYVYAANIDGESRVDGYLSDRGIALEAKRALKEISLRVWASNPTWKRLFV
ncbi:hypothetical protein [Streptomyces zinciresistens]|uniref:hypothetical protein n=1 Tax=Streptomyces zinciresistens TaxID=1073330 RepID=UPI001111AA6B|nr:hypothetical protein [Streptomyces zinciresistens]